MALASSWFKFDPVFQKAAENSPPLKKGALGESVRILQQALIELGYPLPISTAKYGSPDGDYGNETKGAVELFQTKNGLASEADGRVGKNTLAKLDQRMVALGKPRPNLPPLGGDVPITLDPLAADVVAILREPAVQMIDFTYAWLWSGGSQLLKVARAIEQGHIRVAHDSSITGWAEYVAANDVEQRNQLNLWFDNPRSDPFYRSVVVHEAVHAYQDIQGRGLPKYTSEGMAFAVQAWYHMAVTNSSIPPLQLLEDPLVRDVYLAAVLEIQEGRANATMGIVNLWGHRLTSALKLVPAYAEMRENIPYDGVPGASA